MRLSRLAAIAAAAAVASGLTAASASAGPTSSLTYTSLATVVLSDPCDGGKIEVTGTAQPNLPLGSELISMSGLLLQTSSGGLSLAHWEGSGPDPEGVGRYQGIFNGAGHGVTALLTTLGIPYAGLIHNQIEGESIAFSGILSRGPIGFSSVKPSSVPLSLLLYPDHATCVDDQSGRASFPSLP